MRTSLKRRFGKAFTLIELLIVITIIGILAVALIPRVTQGPAKARDVKRKSDVQNIGTALELYYSDNASYPATPTPDPCASGLSTDLDDYTQAIPSDPNAANVTLTSCTGQYYYKKLGSAFFVAAKLEQATTGGDNIYCGFTESTLTGATDYATALGALTTTPTCTAGTAYYIVLR